MQFLWNMEIKIKFTLPFLNFKLNIEKIVITKKKCIIGNKVIQLLKKKQYYTSPYKSLDFNISHFFSK